MEKFVRRGWHLVLAVLIVGGLVAVTAGGAAGDTTAAKPHFDTR